MNSNASKYPCTNILFVSPSSNLAIQKDDFKVLFSSFQVPLARMSENVSNQLSYLQEALSALQHNPPNLQVPVTHFGGTDLELRAP